MKKLLVLFLLVFMLGCSSKDSDVKVLKTGELGQILQDGKWVDPKEPPSGWCIVTDGTQFTWRTSEGYIGKYYSFHTKEEAVKGSWSWYRHRNDPLPPVIKHGPWKVVPSPGCSE
jgi:hypothetical protein